MKLIDLSTEEKIAEAFAIEKEIKISEESKVFVVTDKPRHLKVYPGGSVTFTDGKVSVDPGKEPRKSKMRD